MDHTIKSILGEDALEDELPAADVETLDTLPGESTETVVEDPETEELANLWTSGNKSEVIRRYKEMDNERAVRLVFAIGLDGALDLAQIVDQEVITTEDSAEPEEIIPARDHVEQIIGEPAEVA